MVISGKLYPLVSIITEVPDKAFKILKLLSMPIGRSIRISISNLTPPIVRSPNSPLTALPIKEYLTCYNNKKEGTKTITVTRSVHWYKI